MSKIPFQQKENDSAVNLDAEIMRQFAIRIGFLGSGLYLFSVGGSAYGTGELLWTPHLLAMDFAVYGLAFALCWLAATSQKVERQQFLILISVVLSVFFQYYLSFYSLRTTPTITDAFLVSDYAADLLLLGENPYSWDMQDAYTAYRVSTFFVTPLLSGKLLTELSYPALHFLVLVPFKVLRFADTRLVLLLALIGIIVLLYTNAPVPLKGIVLFPLFVSPDYVNWPIGFVTDSVWVFLLLAMVAAWQRPTWRALLFGLACAYKQQPWLLAPFLALRLWLDDDDADSSPSWQRVGKFTALSVAVFLLINAPFILADAPSWRRAIFTPLNIPLIYYGQGLSAVTQFGLLPLSKPFYMFASLIVLVTLALLYWLNFRVLKEVVWIFPGLFMWFSYRAIQNYFVYWLLLVLMAFLSQARMPAAKRLSLTPSLRLHRYSWAVVALGLLCVTISAAYYLSTATPLTVELIGGDGISIHEINQLQLRITNTTDQKITPRIAVQVSRSQPYPWRIESGPTHLAPAESGIYQIATDLFYGQANLSRGALVVVTDASGDYDLRGTVTIGRELSLAGANPIFNANYLSTESVPTGWHLHQVTSNPATVRKVESAEEFSVVELTLFASEAAEWEYVGLSQWIPFPTDELLAWLQPPPSTSTFNSDSLDLPLPAYGLEFDDGQRRLWLLFGAQSSRGYLSENHYYLSQPAPPQVWSQQRVNLRNLYDELEWPLPPLQRVVQGDKELLIRMVTVRLLLGTHDQDQPTAISAKFGPLTVDFAPDTIEQRIKQRVAHQPEYYLALGDLAQRQRNYEKAEEHYRQALSLEPDFTTAYFKIAEVLFWQEKYTDAEIYYYQAANDPRWQAASNKGIGWVRYNLGQYNEAKDYFEAAIESDPNLADAYNGLGWVFLQKNDCDKAVSYFQKALTFEPNFPEPQQGLELCH